MHGSILDRETREGNARPEIVVCGRRYINETTTRCDGSKLDRTCVPRMEREREKEKKIWKIRIVDQDALKFLRKRNSLPNFTFEFILTLRESLKDFILILFRFFFPSQSKNFSKRRSLFSFKRNSEILSNFVFDYFPILLFLSK